jgi:hypothetical protein
MASLCHIGLHGISRQERCHLAALSLALEPSRGRGVGWATMGSSGCADAHRIAGGTGGDAVEQQPANTLWTGQCSILSTMHKATQQANGSHILGDDIEKLDELGIRLPGSRTRE